MTERNTRRGLLVGLAAAPLAALLPVEVAAQPVPPEWRDLIRTCGALHPEGEAAAIRAYLVGCDVEAFSGVTVSQHPDGHTEPVLTFGPWEAGGSYRVVTPTQSGTYTPTDAGRRWMAARRAQAG